MLFTGKPGTGKTMMAEAIAHTLQKNLLIANYAQIQNKYVGETEKQIVNIFQKAKEQDDVLLWDEADSMFYRVTVQHNHGKVEKSILFYNKSNNLLARLS